MVGGLVLPAAAPHEIEDPCEREEVPGRRGRNQMEHAVHTDPGPGRRCGGFEPEQRDHPVDVDEQQRFVAGMR